MLRTDALEPNDKKELFDLKLSLEQDGKSHNLELLSSLLENCQDTIKDISHKIHEIAKRKLYYEEFS